MLGPGWARGGCPSWTVEPPCKLPFVYQLISTRPSHRHPPTGPYHTPPKPPPIHTPSRSPQPLEFFLSGSTGSLLVVAVASLRIFLAWKYVGDRLLTASLEYEETGW